MKPYRFFFGFTAFLLTWIACVTIVEFLQLPTGVVMLLGVVAGLLCRKVEQFFLRYGQPTT
jgi:hypothetical protein